MAPLLVAAGLFIVGVVLVLGGYHAVTRLPQYLVERRVQQRMADMTTVAEENIVGVNVDYQDIKSWPVLTGSFFTEQDVQTAAKVCLLGTNVAENLFGDVTRAVEDILGAESVVRTKLANASLMETAAMEQVAFAGASDGGCIWPDFLPAVDAAVTLAKLLDLLAAPGAFLVALDGVTDPQNLGAIVRAA